MINKKIEHGGTFYYILKCHHSSQTGEDYVTFDVFAYEYHDGDDDNKFAKNPIEAIFLWNKNVANDYNEIAKEKIKIIKKVIK